jgi:hypothetical protein
VANKKNTKILRITWTKITKPFPSQQQRNDGILINEWYRCSL